MDEQAFNESFHLKLELYQNDATLEITGTIESSTGENFYHDLGLETLRRLPSFSSVRYERINPPLIYLGLYQLPLECILLETQMI